MEVADGAEVETGTGTKGDMLRLDGAIDEAEVGTDSGREEDLLIVVGITSATVVETSKETLKASTCLIEDKATGVVETTPAAFAFTASASADAVAVELRSICNARVAFMIALP